MDCWPKDTFSANALILLYCLFSVNPNRNSNRIHTGSRTARTATTATVTRSEAKCDGTEDLGVEQSSKTNSDGGACLTDRDSDNEEIP